MAADTSTKAGNNQKAIKTEKRDQGPTVHPDYHFIKVVMTNGTEFQTRSTYGAPGATLSLDIDPSTHPAWTGGTQQLLDRAGRVSRFNSRFGSMSFGKKDQPAT